MGLSGAALNRFRARVDGVLRDVFPAALLIDGVTYAASGPGGRSVQEWVEGGQRDNLRVPFRVPLAAWSLPPVEGMAVDWIVSPSLTIPLEISETGTRPQDGVWPITCRARLV